MDYGTVSSGSNILVLGGEITASPKGPLPRSAHRQPASSSVISRNCRIRIDVIFSLGERFNQETGASVSARETAERSARIHS